MFALMLFSLQQHHKCTKILQFPFYGHKIFYHIAFLSSRMSPIARTIHKSVRTAYPFQLMLLNHYLEAMAKQQYDYWFVQFDFPDENGKPHKSSGGKMVWNDKLKREIPEG